VAQNNVTTYCSLSYFDYVFPLSTTIDIVYRDGFLRTEYFLTAVSFPQMTSLPRSARIAPCHLGSMRQGGKRTFNASHKSACLILACLSSRKLLFAGGLPRLGKPSISDRQSKFTLTTLKDCRSSIQVLLLIWCLL
jgi:hypothetical protein